MSLQKNDYGAVMELTVKDESGDAVDLSSASTYTITFRKPDGSTATKDLSFGTDGSDGVVTYTFIDGDLDQAGLWTYQVSILLPSGEFHSRPQSFRVIDSFSDIEDDGGGGIPG